ncbi:MAG: hypothetical protein PHC61_15065 [Chitinivibrionales bacterium]|nr:hypothetical protein [Chitinivibrionales bacterium]
MDGVNLQASINNIPQMDRFQQDVNRTPLVNQEQNAALSREQQARRALRPDEPESADGKTIDPRDGKKNLADKKKKRLKQLLNEKNGDDSHAGRPNNSGFIIDFKA